MRLFLLLLAATLTGAVVAQADGISVSKDLKHVTEEHTTITLTAKQIRDVEHLRVVYLTDEQLKPLQKICAKAPRKLRVLSSRYDDCLCDVEAYAVWCRPGELDIPYRGIEAPESEDEYEEKPAAKESPTQTSETLAEKESEDDCIGEEIILDSKGWMYIDGRNTDENELHDIIDKIATKPSKAREVNRYINFDTPPPISSSVDKKIRDLINRTKAYSASKGVECSAMGMR